MPRASCPICRTPHHRLGRRNPLAALAVTPKAIMRAVGRTPDAVLRRRPAPAEWSVTEVLGHLLDAEVALGFRIRKAVAEPGSPMVAWNQETFTEALRHRRGAAAETLVAYVMLRAATVALVRRLAPAQRRARGLHPDFGPIRVSQLLEHFAEHDLNHLGQIRDTLRAVRRRVTPRDSPPRRPPRSVAPPAPPR